MFVLFLNRLWKIISTTTSHCQQKFTTTTLRQRKSKLWFREIQEARLWSSLWSTIQRLTSTTISTVLSLRRSKRWHILRGFSTLLMFLGLYYIFFPSKKKHVDEYVHFQGVLIFVEILGPLLCYRFLSTVQILSYYYFIKQREKPSEQICSVFIQSQ